MLVITLGFIGEARPLATSLKMDLFAQLQMLVPVTPGMALCPSKGEPTKSTCDIQALYLLLKSQGRPGVRGELFVVKTR